MSCSLLFLQCPVGGSQITLKLHFVANKQKWLSLLPLNNSTYMQHCTPLTPNLKGNIRQLSYILQMNIFVDLNNLL